LKLLHLNVSKSDLKIKIGILFLLFFGLGAGEAFSQKFVLLQRGANQKSRLKFEIGEDLTYKAMGMDYFVTDRIVDITPEVIVLTENLLQPRDIASIYIKNKDPRNSTIKNLGYLGMGGGIIFLITTSVNSLYQRGDLSEVSDTIGWPIGLIAGGFLVSRLQYREFKNQGRNKIQLIILYGE
jgi:hypothetical protein